MKGTRFYKTVIVILILINITTLSFIWLGKPPHQPMPEERNTISNRIGLYGDAKTTVDALEKAHHIEKREMMRTNRELHSKIFEQLDGETPPIELQKELDSNRSAMSKMTYVFFKAVSAECNSKQKEELKLFIRRELALIIGQPNGKMERSQAPNKERY
ncbi:MAG: hypothetical protein MK105_06110 [Crocinitomicaceae bacterium]|nr:hypothetical protein [Crocinitomicaceae bacterium]